MLSKLKAAIGRNRYFIFFTLVLVGFCLGSFFHGVVTGSLGFVIDTQKYFWFFLLLRVFLYVGLAYSIIQKCTPQKRKFLLNLLASAIVVYELLIVFNLPDYIFSLLGA